MNKPILSDSASDIDGSIESVIEHFKKQKEYLESQGYTNIRVEMETEYGYYDDSWTAINYYGTKLPKKKKEKK